MEDRSKYKSYGAFIGIDIGDDCIKASEKGYNKATRKDDNRHLAAYPAGPFVNEVYINTEDFIDEMLEDEVLEDEM